jgi:hypothetical protein
MGDLAPGPPRGPRALASNEFAPPKGAPAPTVPPAGAGTPKVPPVASALTSPAKALLPVRARAMRNLLSAPEGAAFSAPLAMPASAPSAGLLLTVGARIVGVGRRGGGAAAEPDVPNSGASAEAEAFCPPSARTATVGRR